MLPRLSGKRFFSIFVVIVTVLAAFICAWEILLHGRHLTFEPFPSLPDGMKIPVSGERHSPGVEYLDRKRFDDPAMITKKSAAMEKEKSDHAYLNSFQYSPPYDTTLVGRVFYMNESLLNLAQAILTSETFKRKPLRLNSVESFPEIVPVTAASRNHFEELMCNTKFFPSHFPGVKVLFYDLGLSKRQAEHMKKLPYIEYRTFEFSRYPAHIKNLHNYAWKILVIQRALSEVDGVAWFDASVRFRGNFDSLKKRMISNKSGVQYYINITRKTICSVAHPGTMEYFPMQKFAAFANTPLAGGLVLLNTFEVQRNIMKWATICAITEDCISPPESIKEGGCKFVFPRERFSGCHRYDQAVFIILVANAYRHEQYRYTLKESEFFATVVKNPTKGRTCEESYSKCLIDNV